MGALEIASEGFHSWDDGEVARFEQKHPVGSTTRLAFAIMLYTGAARADACRLGWAHVRDGRLRYRRKKTERTTAALIDIPLHPDLEEVLDALPSDKLTFLQTIYGRARSANGLGNMMRAWCDVAGLPECTSHGLRRACARRLAEAGATPHEIMAVTGHPALEMVTLYARAASRAGMAEAAFEKLSSRKVLANRSERFAKKTSNPHERKD